MFRSLLHWMVGSLLLALVTRTWLLLGIFEPVTVSGNSMAPHLHGASWKAQCPKCENLCDYAADSDLRDKRLDCPQCGSRYLPLAKLELQRPDNLWIDRTAYIWRQPRRWETVVLRTPDDDHRLCIKRVVGLPGEVVELRHGDVWINGQVAHKSLADQRAMRLPIHHHENNFVLDNLPYNIGLSRKLHLVQDFMLSAKVQILGAGNLMLSIDDGRHPFRITLVLPEGQVLLHRWGQLMQKSYLSPPRRELLKNDIVQVELSNFDRQLLLAIGDRLEVCLPLADSFPPAGVAEPLSIEVAEPHVLLGDPLLFRDIHYLPQCEGARRRQTDPICLQDDEFFLLGDNSPISLDSRSWGPVSADLLAGKPLLDR